MYSISSLNSQKIVSVFTFRERCPGLKNLLFAWNFAIFVIPPFQKPGWKEGFSVRYKFVMKQLKQKVEKLGKILGEKTKNIVVVSHTNPDGDAVGSSMAWAQVLRSLGHSVKCVVPNKYPYFLDWMTGIEDVIIYKGREAETDAIVNDADIIFCLDFNQIDRLEALSDAIHANEDAERILIDHHLDPPEKEYDLMISDHESCSTSYLVYKVAELLTGTDVITKASAEALYVGIMTDTGNFSFSYLTADLFRAVAILVEKGIDIPAINSAVYNSYSEERVRLLGYVLINKMHIIQDGMVAYIPLKERELRRFNFQIGDSEGFVNYPLTIGDVRMSAMFLQTRKYIRISLRSRGDIDVNIFARRYFQGGGHRNAAGGKSFVTMEETVEHFKSAVAEFFSETD